MLMFLGISGRFMFFTAETARAGAPAMPACEHTRTNTQSQWCLDHGIKIKINKNHTKTDNTDTQITFHRYSRHHMKCKAHHRWVQTGIPVLTAQYAHACLGSISSVTKSTAEKAVTMEAEPIIKRSWLLEFSRTTLTKAFGNLAQKK